MNAGILSLSVVQATSGSQGNIVGILHTHSHCCTFLYETCSKGLKSMNVKRIFGAVLTILGISSLIYAAVVFTTTASGSQNTRLLITFSVLGLLFFGSGIGLIRNTKDEAKP